MLCSLCVCVVYFTPQKLKGKVSVMEVRVCASFSVCLQVCVTQLTGGSDAEVASALEAYSCLFSFTDD